MPNRESISTSRRRTSGTRTEQRGLGLEFLDQLRTTYDQIAARRALLRRFPYAVYFAVEGDLVIVLAVLHGSRDPAEWQRRRG